MHRPQKAICVGLSALGIFFTLACGTLWAVELGNRVEAFTLPDVHGRDRSLAELADKPIVVVAFLGTECPLARLYAPRLQELSDEYAERGVAFVGIDANAQDSLADMAAFVQHFELKFPLLKDRDQSVADQFGALRNPQVFVLDRERAIRYRGRIDDQYGLGSSSGYARSEVKRRDLGIALDELLADKSVSQADVTQSIGCLIGRKPKVEPHGEVTYARHIASLLDAHCVRCHREGEVGPFSLTDYEEVVGWAGMMREVVSNGRMPPWSASPKYGHFLNDARLSEEQKQLLYTWVDHGCPQGNPADMPAPRQWTAGWRIQQPDQVMRMPKPFKVPAEGVVSYQHILIDPGWTEDKWIQQAEVRPGNAAVVHHIIAFIMPPNGLNGLVGPRGQGARAGAGEGMVGRGGGLTAYVPGSEPTVYQPGVATLVPKGSKIVFQMHYTPNGTAQEDTSYLGVVFADPTTVKKRVHGGAAASRGLTIPAHADNHEVVSSHEFRSDQLLISMSPHMHLRGKSFRFEAQYPDGSQEVLLDVPKYDFNWQIRYLLAEPKRMPAGTKLVCTAHFDNSENNIANPNPNETVHWGPQTWHEMMIGFFTAIAVNDDAHVAQVPEAETGEVE